MWNDQRLAQAKQLYADGYSAGQIAAQLGITRNAVIGQAHRRHWARKGDVPATPGRSDVVSARPPALRGERPKTASTDPMAAALQSVPHRLRPFARVKASRTEAASKLLDRTGAEIAERTRVTDQNHVLEVFDRTEPVDLPVDESPNPVNFEQLERHHCRWPVDRPEVPMMYCGDGRFGEQSYCARHFAISRKGGALAAN